MLLAIIPTDKSLKVRDCSCGQFQSAECFFTNALRNTPPVFSERMVVLGFICIIKHPILRTIVRAVILRLVVPWQLIVRYLNAFFVIQGHYANGFFD